MPHPLPLDTSEQLYQRAVQLIPGGSQTMSKRPEVMQVAADLVITVTYGGECLSLATLVACLKEYQDKPDAGGESVDEDSRSRFQRSSSSTGGSFWPSGMIGASSWLMATASTSCRPISQASRTCNWRLSR